MSLPTKEKLQKLRDKGFTLREIAVVYGGSRQGVHNKLKRIPSPRKTLDLDRVVDLLNDDYKQIEVAGMVGVSHAYISALLVRGKIKRKVIWSKGAT